LIDVCVSDTKEYLIAYENEEFNVPHNFFERIKDTYKIRIIFDEYFLPSVYEISEKIKKFSKEENIPLIDLHTYKNNGICYAGEFAKRKFILDKKGLRDFFEEMVIPFFYDQSYFRKHKQWIRGELQHGTVGVLEEYFRLKSNTFDDLFYVPHSRHTEVKREDIEKEAELEILSESEESGIYLAASKNGRQVFATGHSEYDRESLQDEYLRDINKGMDIDPPKNYYRDDDPEKEIIMRWRSHANLLFVNWLNYYVYQETPFDLSQLK